MIKVRMEKKPAVKIAGRKIWISGTDNELFHQFWEKSNANGFVALLKKLCRTETILNSQVFGVSCVEKNPSDRSFYFYIAAECEQIPGDMGLEEYNIPPCEWAVFENRGSMPRALVDAEMYAFMEWLPGSGYVHAEAPELELYPPDKEEAAETAVEFWLPVKKKEA